MPRLCVCVTTDSGHPDDARGAIEILRSDAAERSLGNIELLHAHSLTPAEWPGSYLGAQDILVPDRIGELGRAERLNAVVAAAARTDCDYAIVIDSECWPLHPKLLAVLAGRMIREGQLLGAAALLPGARIEPPRGGLWPRLLALDLGWQASKRLFPLDFATFREQALTMASHWQVPTLDACLSGAYFKRIALSTEADATLAVALGQLCRFHELEPVLAQGRDEVFNWPDLGLVRDPRPAARAQQVLRNQADDMGPTLARLISAEERDWYNTPHAHPLARHLPDARPVL